MATSFKGVAPGNGKALEAAAYVARMRDQAREKLLRVFGYLVPAGAFFYLLMGVPSLVREETVASDEVSPYHRMICLCLFGLALPVLLMRWRQALRLAGRCWPLLVLSVWFAVSVLWAIDPAASLRRMMLHWLYIGILMAPLLALRDIKRVHLVLACVGVVGAVANFGALVAAPGLSMSNLGFTGLLPQKNMTGMVMMVSLLATTSAGFMVTGRGMKLLLWGGAALSAFLLVLTRSSTSISLGLVGLLIMPVAAVLAKLEKPVVRSVLIVSGLAALVLPLLYFVVCAWLDVDPLAPLEGVTFTQRTDIWTFEWGEIVKRPWQGYGFGSFWAIDPAVQPSFKVDQWFANPDNGINQGHNGYLDILATVGWVGMGLLLAMIARALYLAWWLMEYVGDLYRRERATGRDLVVPAFSLAMMLVILVHNVTESTLFSAAASLGEFFVLIYMQLEWVRGMVLRER